MGLLRENVRYTLGNTVVNKSIRGAVAKKANHGDFILGHNGLIILCSSAENDVASNELKIKDYSVVNGAQSLTSFFTDKAKLTDDLRVLVRVIQLQDEALAREITQNSNNQNAIKPRDLRSNHAIMVHLQTEMNKEPAGGFFFEIKRGEKAPAGKTVIPNDEVGRALLSFDIQEPWSAHQIYKVFDDKYAEIFGGPSVTARRVIFVHELLKMVSANLHRITNRPMASYTLTRFFLLYVLSRILRGNPTSQVYVSDPSLLDDAARGQFLKKCEEILKTVIVDLNYKTKAVDFDYKSVLKSPKQSTELADRILASYEKDMQRDKADYFTGWAPTPKSENDGPTKKPPTPAEGSK